MRVIVGSLAALRECDASGIDGKLRELQAVNVALEASGLPPHREPEYVEHDEYDLQFEPLIRLALHLDSEGVIPGQPYNQYLDEPDRWCAYLRARAGKRPSFLDRWRGRAWSFAGGFEHLLTAGPYFVPQRFERPAESGQLGSIGSVPRLLDELDELAGVLGIPDTPTIHEFNEELDAEEPRDRVFQTYCDESTDCASLRFACRHSLATGGILEFAW